MTYQAIKIIRNWVEYMLWGEQWPTAIDFLMVWGWGGGWGWCNRWNISWSWGWAWWIIYRSCYEIVAWTYEVIIGSQGNWWWTNSDWNNWWNTTFNWITAYWWGGGWSWCWTGRDWWSGWWGKEGYRGRNCTWQWNSGWQWRVIGSWTSWWGGGWSWWVWGDSNNYEYGGSWWLWVSYDISWEELPYAGWWWGGGYSWGWSGSCGGGNWARYGNVWAGATTYWSWGGGWIYNRWGGSWYQWIFIVRYPTACWYNIEWGCKYTCWDYTIHCFTANWTLTVN